MKTKDTRLVIATAFCIMLVFGFVENLKGMAIPPIRQEFGVDFSAIGIMVFFSSLGYMIACFFGGEGSEKYGEKSVLTLGYVLIISSASLLYFSSSIYYVFGLMFLMFAGMGFFESGSNALGSKIFTKNSAIMMNILHLFYGIGAIIGPKFAGVMLLSGFSWKQYYLIAAIIISGFFVFMLITKFPPKIKIEENTNTPFKLIISNSGIWLLGIALGFGVTIEIGTSNWLVNYLCVEYKMGEANTSFYMSLFYVTFVFGRLLGGFIVEKVGYLRCIILFVLSTLILYVLGSIFKANGAIFVSMAGFFIAIIFPTTMAIIIREYKTGTGTIMGFVITLSAGINMICNWIIGKTNDIFGVYIGFITFIIYIGLTILLFTIYGICKKSKLALKEQNHD